MLSYKEWFVITLCSVVVIVVGSFVIQESQSDTTVIIRQSDSGSNGTGTGKDGQVAFWNSNTTIAGNDQHYWNDTTKQLFIGDSHTSELPLYDIAKFYIQSNTSDVLPDMTLRSSTQGAFIHFMQNNGNLTFPTATSINDVLGTIDFVGFGDDNWRTPAFIEVISLNSFTNDLHDAIMHIAATTIRLSAQSGVLQLDGHTVSLGSSPSVSNCGSGFSIIGNDMTGKVTTGTGIGLSSCKLTFTAAWANAPSCFVNDETGLVLLQAVTTVNTLTINSVSAFPSHLVSYHCFGYE